MPYTRRLVILLFACAATLLCRAEEPPRDSVPDDHLAWFGLHGPVAEVREYDYSGHSKTVWRFDTQGRLTEYENYGSPFAGDGGCVFRLTDRYRYDYDKNGKIIFLETYNDEYTLIDEYADIILELFPPQDTTAVRLSEAMESGEAEKEYGDTTWCVSKWQDIGETQHYNGIRFDRYGNWIESVSAEPGDSMKACVRVREISYYPAPPKTDDPRLTSLDQLPEGCSKESAFGLIFTFRGYVFEGLLYPLHNKTWIVLSYWCLDEEETIFTEDGNGEDVPAASLYKDPFEGLKYPVVTTDSVSFSTRNYGGKTIPLYRKSKGRRVECRLNVECSLDVLDADPKTRRVFCRSNPNDWMWGEPQNEEEKEWKKPFVSVIGWVDEEWICANLMTTCP